MRLINRMCLLGMVAVIGLKVTAEDAAAKEPLVTVSTDRRIYLNRVDQQLAYWRFESPDMLGEETSQYRLEATSSWGPTPAFNPVSANRSALNTRTAVDGAAAALNAAQKELDDRARELDEREAALKKAVEGVDAEKPAAAPTAKQAPL